MGNNKKKKNKKSNKFVPVRAINPPKQRQQKFESDGATVETNKGGILNERILMIGKFIGGTICIILGFYLTITNVQDENFLVKLSNAEFRGTLVGVFVMLGGVWLFYSANSDIKIHNQK